MKVLRTMGSGLAIILGTLVLAGWVLAFNTVKLVADDDVLSGFASRAFADEEFMAALDSKTQEALREKLAEDNIDLALLGIEQEVDSIVSEFVHSPEFEDLFVNALQQMQRQIHAQLTDNSAGDQPIVFTLDTESEILALLGSDPVVSLLLPAVEVPPVESEIIGAEDANALREIYQEVESLSESLVWVGVALILAGFWLSTRKKWFATKVFLTWGVVLMLVWFALASFDMRAFLEEASVDEETRIISNAMAPFEQFDSMTHKVLLVALWCLALSALTYAFVRFILPLMRPNPEKPFLSQMPSNSNPMVTDNSSNEVPRGPTGF